MRYAGLGMQLFVSLGLAVFAGYKVDKWIGMKFPVLVWALPLVVLFLIIYKLIKETSKRNDR
jgi:chromate transport protein ChrA